MQVLFHSLPPFVFLFILLFFSIRCTCLYCFSILQALSVLPILCYLHLYFLRGPARTIPPQLSIMLSSHSSHRAPGLLS